MALREWMLVLAAATSLGLAGCHRGADTGATANANAPGRPGTGNGVQVATPRIADSSGGRGSSGEKGSMPAAGSSGGGAPVGTTGKGGASAMGGPGAGFAGGMNPAPGQPTGVAGGSTNSTTKSAVGGTR